MKTVSPGFDYCCYDSSWDLFLLDLGPGMTIKSHCGLNIRCYIKIKTRAKTLQLLRSLKLTECQLRNNSLASLFLITQK